MGFGSMASIGRAVADRAVGVAAIVGCSSVAVRDGSSAESPLPSALRCLSVAVLIGQNLLGELDITLSALGPRIVHKHRFAEAGSLGEPDATGNHSFEDFIPKELFEVVGD